MDSISEEYGVDQAATGSAQPEPVVSVAAWLSVTAATRRSRASISRCDGEGVLRQPGGLGDRAAHQAARRPVPYANLRAASGAVIPVVMSPRPAGRANSAGR